MTTERALLAAIWADPHDDLPRLVYADWLDETGDPTNIARAEFIRVQCELARVGEYDDRTDQLRKTEQRLLDDSRHLWLPRQRLQHAGVGFDRGFVCPGYRTEIMTFRAEASSTRAVAPLYDLHLEWSDGFEALLKWPPTEGLRQLWLSPAFAW